MNYETERQRLLDEAQACIDSNDFEGFAARRDEINALDDAHRQALEAAASLNALRNEPAPVNLANMSVPVAPAASVGNVKMTAAEPAIIAADGIDYSQMKNSMDYRIAFANYIKDGTPLPPKFANANEVTETGDVGVMIPDTVLLPIIQKLETSGRLYALMRKTNIKGGVRVPTSSVKPVATWLPERGDSETQEKPVTYISFGYYKLKCKVAVTFEVSVITIAAFEAAVIADIYPAMIKAIELAGVRGVGDSANQPTGVLAAPAPTGQNIDIAANGTITFKDVVAAEAALPEEYDSDSTVWVMTKQTFYTKFKTMLDDTKKPISESLGGVDNKIRNVIFGRRVVFVDKDVIPTYTDSVTEDTVFAFMFNWDYYLLNFNQRMIMKEYTDETTDDLVRKALALVDGKPVDRNSLVTLTKKAA